MATTAISELVSVNPATLERVGAVSRTDPADVPKVVAAARAAQEQWLRPAWWFPYDAPTEQALRVLLDVLYGARTERLRAAWRGRRDLVHVARRSLGR